MILKFVNTYYLNIHLPMNINILRTLENNLHCEILEYNISYVSNRSIWLYLFKSFTSVSVVSG